MPLTPRTRRSRESVSSRPRSSSASTSAYSARSAASCETFRPEGVTSCRTTRAAASCSGSVRRSSAPWTCSRTTARAPPIALKRGQPQRTGADRALSLPQPLEHELEVRRLDARLGRRLVQHRLDEGVLRREVLSAQLAVAGKRAEDRRAAGLPVEPVEAEQVPEQLGDPAGELVELGQGVVPHGQQDVDPQPGPAQQLRQRVAQRPLDAVVEHVLLELVEQRCSSPPTCAAAAIVSTSPAVGPRSPHSARTTRSARPRDPRPTSRGPRPAPRSAPAGGARRRRTGASSCRRRSGRRGRSAGSRAHWPRRPPARARARRRGGRRARSPRRRRDPCTGSRGRRHGLSPRCRLLQRHARARRRRPPAPCRSPRRPAAARTRARAAAAPACTDHERYGSGSLPQNRSSTTRSVQVESV